MKEQLTKEQWSAVYDILIEEAGARPAKEWRSDFLYAMLSGSYEYRFGGSLGMWGVLWKQVYREDPLYITCAREDETAERLTTIERTNQRLKEFVDRHGKA